MKKQKHLQLSKPRTSGPAQAYTQGRYRCAACGEFDFIMLGIFECREYMHCPTCDYDALLLGQAKCHGLDPQLGCSTPGDLERRLGYLEKEGRGTRLTLGHGKERLKMKQCKPCDSETFTHGGARSRASAMQSQHARPYNVYPCPAGAGYHVQPLVI